jgi:hypothetical protein
MRRGMKVLLLVVVVAAGVAFWGCNKNLDDPTTAEGILSIESVNPSLVKADITPTDPNTGLPTPLHDDTTDVTVKNRPRTTSTGTFSDIAVTKSERFCTFAGNTIAVGTGPGGFTIPANGSVAITTTAVTAAEKIATGAAVGDSWQCFVKFKGQDLAGNPVETSFAGFIVNFVDE